MQTLDIGTVAKVAFFVFVAFVGLWAGYHAGADAAHRDNLAVSQAY